MIRDISRGTESSYAVELTARLIDWFLLDGLIHGTVLETSELEVVLKRESSGREEHTVLAQQRRPVFLHGDVRLANT